MISVSVGVAPRKLSSIFVCSSSLALMGIVSAGWLWRNLRYSILIIFAIAAIITPTTDIVNMCIFAAPMVVLYLISIGVAWFVHPTRRKARALAR